jgi:hypothetical protein
MIFLGGAERDRTVDLMTASHALSQLSYSPKWLKNISIIFIFIMSNIFFVLQFFLTATAPF